MTQATLETALSQQARVTLAHTPTPIEALNNLSAMGHCSLYVKRDDCTGVGMGGNKIRQLEYYVGDALANNANLLLITGAIQSNFTRSVAAVAAKLNLHCHVQLEQRVANFSEQYTNNGNVFLNQLYGANISYFPEGENEAGADKALEEIAQRYRSDGFKPYIIRLGAEHAPIGALGYVRAAIEFANSDTAKEGIDEIFIASGSALSHIGLLFGLRALGYPTKVTGVCVRRSAQQQHDRVKRRLDDLAQLLNLPLCVKEQDISLIDNTLAPGYGQLSSSTIAATELFASREGLLLDPVYTAKVADAVLRFAKLAANRDKRVLLWHTGGQPAIFAYENQLSQ